MVGISPEKFLDEEDPIKLEALILVAQEAMEIQYNHRKQLASIIINYLGKAFSKEK